MERKPGDSVLYVVLFVTLFIHYPVHGLIQMHRSLRLKDEHQVHTEVIEASCDHLYRESTNRTLEFIYHFVHANEVSYVFVIFSAATTFLKDLTRYICIM